MSKARSQSGLMDRIPLSLLLALTIFVSAFLLFQVQPLISKFILPWFGGSPAVWTTAMLFFQCTLFLGYVYSHLLFSRLSLINQVRVHIGLLAIASVMAIFVIPLDSFKPTGTEDPTVRILLLLAVCVGLPYGVLSTTGPLIQAWFSRAYPGRSPFRLFSLSNIGSLLALGSFPFLFEPFMELKTMGRFWMGGFWVFAAFCTLSGIGTLRRTMNQKSTGTTLGSDVDKDSPVSWHRLAWIGLSALSSLMFIATTNHVCHDIATVPFLWIIPLALYLITFIICFDHPRWYVRELWCGMCVVAIVLLVVVDLELGLIQNLVLHFGTMFLICMVCHGELVRLRPDNRRYITEYYLLISLGGAIGGLFITLIATRYFDQYYEWPIGLLLSFLISGSVFGFSAAREMAFGSSNRRLRDSSNKRSLGPASRCLVVAIAVLATGYVGWHFGEFAWAKEDQGQGVRLQVLYRARNFYGTVTATDRTYTQHIPAEENFGIERDASSGFRSFWSGNVLHGLQWSDPKKQDLPLTYYDHESGVGKTLHYCMEQTHRDRSLKFAVVGLGSGALATYARAAEGSRAADECVMYEINPLVEKIARKYFWYLPHYEQRLGKPIDVRLGDARLTMEREAAQDYDVIVLDAFSGDSVPAHLLTREAFEIYRKHLKKNPDGTVAGMICIHITNTYLNLYPVVKNASEQVMQMKYTSVYKRSDERNRIERSHYFIMTNDQDFLRQTPMIQPFTSALDSEIGVARDILVDQDWPGIPVWTDHYSTIFNILWSKPFSED
jgi:hypothetical protein